MTSLYFLAVIFGCLLCMCQAKFEYDMDFFESEIQDKCLTQLWGNKLHPRYFRPEDLTMENFISLVDKVERKHPTWTIYQVSSVLLKRFAFEEMVFANIAGKVKLVQAPLSMNIWSITSKLLLDAREGATFVENDLTEKEKCNMFFMLGHTVNRTERTQDLDDSGRRIIVTREQGVVNLNKNKHQAISPSKILYAILASQQTVEPLVHEFYQITSSRFPQNQRINPLVGATLGEALSWASVMEHSGETMGRDFFGLAGIWDTASKPSEYRLSKTYGPSITNAILNGAVDGLLIGHSLKNLGAGKNTRLSQLLRSYYSAKGIALQGAQMGVSYCRRQEVVETVHPTDIQKSILAYFYVLMYKEHGQMLTNSREKVARAVREMNSALEDMSSETEEECTGVAKPVAASDIIGTVSKATLYCKEFLSGDDFVGEVAPTGCKVMCLTEKKNFIYNVPEGSFCNNGKGTCQFGECVLENAA